MSDDWKIMYSGNPHQQVIYLERLVTDLHERITLLEAESKRLLGKLEEANGLPDALLTYYREGHRCAGGQTIGADGSGAYAVLFFGPKAEAKAREYVVAIQEGGSGRIINAQIFVNEDYYSGPAIKAIYTDERGNK